MIGNCNVCVHIMQFWNVINNYIYMGHSPENRTKEGAFSR